ncbi:MAG: hypothetical protein NZV14_15405 [Bryobacteraceae bacterium]|nr:hypothetical protein [Bryobacteraceae bacterium]MDW8379549.1 hypothetical protein [Bryobacterales bacterium]
MQVLCLVGNYLGFLILLGELRPGSDIVAVLLPQKGQSLPKQN